MCNFCADKCLFSKVFTKLNEKRKIMNYYFPKNRGLPCTTSNSHIYTFKTLEISKAEQTFE